MTAPHQPETGGGVAAAVRDEAEELRDAVSGAGSEVLDVTKDRVGDVADELRRSLTTEADHQVERLHDHLDGMADDLQALAAGEPRPDAPATQLVERGGAHLHATAERLEGQSAEQLVHDLAAWARRRPGMFLLGAATCGVLVGRWLRNMPDRSANDSSDDGPPSRATGGGRSPASMSEPARPVPTVGQGAEIPAGSLGAPGGTTVLAAEAPR